MAQFAISIYVMLTYLIVDIFYCRTLPKQNFIKHPLVSCLTLQAIALIVWYFTFGFTITANFSLLINSLLFVSCILFFKGDFFLRICAGFISHFILTLGEVASGSLFVTINLFVPELNLIPQAMIQEERIGLTLLMILLDILFLVFVFEKLGGLLQNCFQCLKPYLLLRLGGPLAILLYLQTGLYTFHYSRKYLLYSFLYGIAVVISLFILNSALKELETQKVYNNQLELQKKLIDLQLEHFRKATHEYQSIHKWNHDISNHLFALSYLINQGQTDRAGQYIDSLFDIYGLGDKEK